MLRYSMVGMVKVQSLKPATPTRPSFSPDIKGDVEQVEIKSLEDISYITGYSFKVTFLVTFLVAG